MRARLAVGALVAAMITTAGFGQIPATASVSNAAVSDSMASSAANEIVGVWHGEYRGLPWVTVTLTDEGGTLSGAVLFYLHRQTAGAVETATPGVPEPLLDPHFDSTTLSFRVSAHHAGGPASLEEPPIPMTIEFIDADHARLVNQQDPHLTGVLTRASH
ncbi:MAG: hypothetical protein WCB58_07880 [Acidobacteriaceae bacterium]